MRNRIDQDMAAAASEVIDGTVNRELRTRYRHLRVMLHTAGLAATYAFIAAKSTGDDKLATAYRKAADGIRKRLTEQHLMTGDWRSMNASDVLHQLGEMSGVDYARASAETAAFAGWLSRLADAMYQPSDSETGPAENRRPQPADTLAAVP